MNTINKNLIGLIAFSLFFLSSYLLNQNKSRNEEELLTETKKVTIGKITSFGYAYGGAVGRPQYEFKVNSKKYKNGTSINLFCKKLKGNDERYIRTLNFPVLYYPLKPEVSRLLVKRSDFKKYGIEYPDSLASVLQTYFECD